MEVDHDLTKVLLAEPVHSQNFKSLVNSLVTSLNEEELIKLVSKLSGILLWNRIKWQAKTTPSKFSCISLTIAIS
jgi:hypothetical protein